MRASGRCSISDRRSRSGESRMFSLFSLSLSFVSVWLFRCEYGRCTQLLPFLSDVEGIHGRNTFPLATRKFADLTARDSQSTLQSMAHPSEARLRTPGAALQDVVQNTEHTATHFSPLFLAHILHIHLSIIFVFSFPPLLSVWPFEAV